MKKLNLLFLLALLFAVGGAKADNYSFNAYDWAYTGDGNRIAQDNISVSENVITVKNVPNKGDGKNACLKFGSASTYTFDHSAVALVIKGTNLSTDVSKQALWWINNRNNGSTLNPVSATEEGGIVTLTWSLVNIAYHLRSNILNSWTLSNAGTSTLFGLTPADFGNNVTITDIEWQCVSDAYVYNANDWAHTGDPARIAQDNISVSNNVITLADVSGDNNAALEFNGTNEYLFPRSLATITITGTNLSLQAGKHAFWWLNGANNAGSINATSVSESDGQQSVTWDLTAIAADMRPTIVGEWEMRTKSAYLAEDWKHSTLFGLTPAAPGDVTITNIGLTMVDDANVVTRTMAAGRFGTICLPKQALPSGADIYSVSSISDGNLSLEKVDGYMAAGVPYLFKATQDNPTFTMSGAAVDAPVEVTGLVGTFEPIPAPKGDEYYVLSNNKLYNVDAAANVNVGANRAYINLNAVPTTSARGSVFLTLEGYDPTGIGEIRTDNTPTDNSASDVIYDLYGRRVSHPQRGIYVVNGKKILFK